jgi:hypothetical protein
MQIVLSLTVGKVSILPLANTILVAIWEEMGIQSEGRKGPNILLAPPLANFINFKEKKDRIDRGKL